VSIVSAFGWAALQSWSVKLLSLLLFFVLARLLSKEDLGSAQSVFLLLTLVGVIAEQGLFQAIIRDRDLGERDLDAPFAAIVAMATVLALVMLVGAGPIARLFGAPAIAPLVRIAAVVPPLTAVSGFTTALLKRQLDTAAIARATMMASVVSGIVAMALACAGVGAMSLVVQVIVLNALLAARLWSCAVWRPRAIKTTTAFRRLFRYSSAIFLSRCVDFATARIVEFFILSRLGIGALGLFAVASKLYLTMIELFAATVFDVALSSLSRFRDSPARFRETYLAFVTLATCCAAPIFVLVSSVAPEICAVLFGSRWAGAEAALRWLCLLGAFETVQYFNGASLGAAARPRLILLINVAKLVGSATALAFASFGNIESACRTYALALMLVSPLSFWTAAKVNEFPLKVVARLVFAAVCTCVLCSAAVGLTRSMLADLHLRPIVSLPLLVAVFTLALGACLAIARRDAVVQSFRFVRGVDAVAA
jgi:PST family polysaccharide transporter